MITSSARRLSIAVIICSMSLAILGQSKDGEVHIPEAFPGPYIHISSMEVTGNERTRDRIIFRELDFSRGDSLATFEDNLRGGMFSGSKRYNRVDSSEVVRRMKYSRENIINTQLFLSADLYLEQVDGNEYKLRINVQERWYFWVFPVVQLDYPNFNDWLQDPDLSRLTQGIFMSHNNLFGLSHQGSVLGYFGSSQGVGLGYYIPWIGKGEKIGMRLGALYRNSTVVEYGSLENERQLIFEEGSLKQFDLLATFTLRPGLYNYGKLRITASSHSVSDRILALTASDSLSSFLPDDRQSASFLNMYLEYSYDSRNNRAYPLKGNYLKGFVDKRGMGILSHNVDYFFYGVDMHFYQKLGERWYTAEMFKMVSTSSADISYHFRQKLTDGDDFIRGYDFFALRGDEMYYFRSNLKYNVIKPGIMPARKEKHKDSKFRNLPYAFYINAIADVAYINDDFYGMYNPYNNRFLYTWGLGVDFISYYDLVLRFEYVFTNIGTHGFFFGFGLPV